MVAMRFWTTKAEKYAKGRDVAALIRLLDGATESAYERATAARSFVDR